MSKITLTDLPEGEVATAADYNANMTSWNTATAAGAVNDQNIREQGIDRRPIADRAIDLTRIGTNAFYEQFDSTPTLIALGGVATLVVINGVDAKIGPANVVSGDSLIIECSIYGYCGTSAGGGTNGQTLFYLQRSSDNAAWSTVAESRQMFSTNADMLVAFVIEGVVVFPWRGSYTVTVLHHGGAGATWYYRLMCETTVEDAYVEGAILYFREEG